ncbi:MAG: FHA domain-containing protein [Gammaproteobacteria bacterium]
MDKEKNNHNDILHTLKTENANLRGRIQDLETYIDGRKTRWDALAAKLIGERQTIADLESAVQVRDARIAGFARTTARLERRMDGQRREIEILRERRTDALQATANPTRHSGKEEKIILRAAYDKLAAMRAEQTRLREELEEKNAYVDQLCARLSELELERRANTDELRRQRGIIDHIENEIRARLTKVARNSRKPERQREITTSIMKLDADRARNREYLPDDPVTTMGRLRLLADDGNGAAYEIGARTISVGRGPHNDIRLERASVSREHARITPTVDGILIEDLCSRNGIRINGERVARRNLQSGDIVMVGQVKFRYTTSVIPFNRHNAS